MKLYFVAARSNHDLTTVLKKVKIKEKKIGLVASIQLVHRLPEVKKKIKNSIIVGQILGCNFTNIDKAGNVDAYLYIGSAAFHPVGLAWHTKKPVYIANPFTNEFTKLPETIVKKYEQQKRGKLLKFLHAKTIGIIVSTKPHQGNMQRARKLQELLHGEKKSYIFLCDNLDVKQFENFSKIETWVNTACPRIEDPNIVNYNDIIKLFKA
ncbi:MAG: diphthamide synthesis protein [Nanoarchaeota archaeon]|nr:diphthamide synthesis protein [Nanoarchaeota archaeon]